MPTPTEAHFNLLCNGEQVVSIAGTGQQGYNGDDQPATTAQLNCPLGVVVSHRNEVYISEGFSGHRLRKICRNGTIQTIAGDDVDGFSGDGQLATSARKDSNGIISTIAGNDGHGYNGDNILATEAQLSFPTSVFKYKNEIYITDYGNDRIRKILENGIIITIAASGECGFNGDNQLASAAQLKQPYCLSVHNDEVYFSDMGNHRIRKILSNGTIQTIAGNGIGGFNGDHILATESLVNSSNSIFVSHVEHVYFTEYGNQRVRMIDSQNGTISTVAGTGIVGYSGDDLFDFTRYFHIGPQKQIKPFSKRKDGPFVPFYHDMAIK